MAANATVPPPHSRRVEAWIYSVLNPVMDGVRREQFLLKSGNLSWRLYSRGFEYLAPVAQYVDSAQQPNLEDFLEDPENEGFEARFRQHDHALAELETATNRLFDYLLHWEPFSKAVSNAYQEYVATPNGSDLAASTMDALTVTKFVAEYLINKVENLQQHYMLNGFWSENRDRFRALFDGAELSSQREPFIQGSGDLSKVSDALSIQLKEHRRRLCTTFDIPAAP